MELRLLGPLELVDDDGRPVALPAGKPRALLALLAVEAGRVVSVDRIVGDLWGEQPPATAGKIVQGYVSRLRKVLPDGLLQTREPGYVLRVDKDQLDLSRFERLRAEAATAAEEGRYQAAADAFAEGLALWRGLPLADFQYESFARNEIGRLEDLRLVTHEERIAADLARGRHAEIVGELEALVRDHPLRERPAALLMIALYRAGRQADALGVYHETRSRLVDELGLDPGEPLQELEKAILQHDPALDLPARPELDGGPDTAKPARADGAHEERKAVTVLFCELDVDEEIDPESLRVITARFLGQAALVVASHGGRLDELVGSELMAVFGVPLVREDDVLRAVRSAVELRDLASRSDGLRVRIGVNTDEVVTDAHGDMTGGAVAAGKRLARDAGWGDIVLSGATHRLVAHAVDVERRDHGFLLASLDREATAVPRRDDAAFVGRTRELERLHRVYSDVVSGKGARLVMVIGEPGIGKSRLARELLAGLAPKPRVLVGRCPPYGEGVTFWPLREVLHQANKDDDALAGSSHEVFARVRRLLTDLATEGPVVVAFDDVHWAEPTFLDLIEYVAARLGDARVFLVCLGRTQFAEQRPAWLQPPSEPLVLDPLPEADFELLLESLGVPVEARAKIAETAEGNPLFAEQLVAVAGELGSASALPGSIRGVLHERLDRLEHAERAVLERAAVDGRSFTLGAVLEVLPPEEIDRAHEHLHALVRKRFVRPDPLALDEGFRFQHALIREAVYEATPKALRADIHEQLASRLEDRAAPDALIGHHLGQACVLRRELGTPDLELAARASQRLKTAGEDAFDHSDVPAAVSLFERALTLLPDDSTMRPSLMIALGDARIKLGDVASAEAVLDDAIEVARTLRDRPAELHAVVDRQFVRCIAASGPTAEESVALANAVIPELERLGAELALARAYWLQSEGDAFACRWLHRAEAVQQALHHARRGGASGEVLGTLSGLLAQALSYGPTPLDDATERVEWLLDEVGTDPARRATINTSRAWLLAMHGRFDEARALYAEAVATYVELGLLLRRATHSLLGAQVELTAGDPLAAERELRAAAVTLSELGTRAVAVTIQAVHTDVLCRLQRWDEADTVARAVVEWASEDDLMPQVLWRAAVARVCVHQGDIDEAARHASDALALSDGVEFPYLRVAALMGAREVELARGRDDESRRLFDEARAALEAKGNLVAASQLGA